MASAEHPSAILFEDSYTVVAWEGNRHVCESATLSLARYQSLGHIVYHAPAGRPWFEQWYLTEYGNTRRLEMLVNGFNQIPALVVGTDRIATVQTRLAQRVAQYLPLRLLQLPMRVPPLVEVIQWSRHRQSDPVHSWLRGRLQAVAGALGPLGPVASESMAQAGDNTVAIGHGREAVVGNAGVDVGATREKVVIHH